MKVKKCRRKYRAWWKEYLGYDFDEELRIYKYLCGIKVFRKPPVNRRFTSYRKWEEYIRIKYKEADANMLQEFYYYLRQYERNASTSQGINYNVMLPVMVAFITGNLIPDYINFKKAFSEVGNISVYVRYICLMCISILLVFCILYIIWTVVNMIYNKNDEYYFYVDYQEIIQKLINEKRHYNLEQRSDVE